MAENLVDWMVELLADSLVVDLVEMKGEMRVVRLG
jgi:hypothetical protein